MPASPLKSHYPAHVHALMARVRALPGEKEVTVQVGSGHIRGNFISANVDEHGAVGCLPQHERELMDTLGIGLLMGADAFVIQTMDDGARQVFGAELHKGTVEWLSGACMAKSQNTHPVTGEILETKPGIHFPEWPAAPEVAVKPKAASRRARPG
jgi:hypothetical protein